MSQLLVIFRKDTRRLWPAVLLGVVLLVVLSAIDSARADYIPSLEESLCNVLLPLFWCGLIFHLVQMESPAAANPFWATRPYRWPALIGAKLLFAVLFIHIPLLLANAAVLSARGFAPWMHVPALLSLQLTLAVVLTMPSLALASVTRTLSQGAWAAALFIIAATALRRYAQPVEFPWIVFDTDSRVAALALLTLAAMAILGLQYARRRTTFSRAIGLASALAAAVIFLYLPRELTASLHTSAPNPARLELRPADSNELQPADHLPYGIRSVSIPLKLSGSLADTLVTTDILSLKLSSSEGFQWEFHQRDNYTPRPNPVQAGIWMRENRLGYLTIRMRQPTYETLKDARLDIHGKLAVNEYNKTEQASVPANSPVREAVGVGRCSSQLIENVRHGDGSEMLKVLCESPEPPPRRVDVILTSGRVSEPWSQFLGDSDTYASYPRITWLSPLHRRQTYFHVSSRAATFPGGGYLVPKAALQDAQLTFIPWKETRRLVVPFSFSNLSLKEGLVQD